MAWSYDTGLSKPLDRVRFKIGDTLQADPLFDDDEIIAILAANAEDVLVASIALIRSLVFRYARLRNVKADDVSIEANGLYKQYKEQLDVLLAEQGASVGSTQGGVLGGEYLKALDVKIY
jgi:hypothetical protein